MDVIDASADFTEDVIESLALIASRTVFCFPANLSHIFRVCELVDIRDDDGIFNALKSYDLLMGTTIDGY